MKGIAINLTVVALVLAPIFFLMAAFTQPVDDIHQHVMEFALPTTLTTTALLLVGVTLLSTLIGTSLAAAVSFLDFPGRRFFSAAFLLPLAVPAYVMAFVAIGLLDYSGPVQTTLRSWGFENLPEIRSIGGAVLVLSLCLYPYVYLLARTSFASLSGRTLEASRCLGMGPLGTFFRLLLPLSLPAILCGSLLVAMECLADFGAVSAFNLDTFTTLIYKSWYALDSFSTASRLSGYLLLPALALLLSQSWLQGRRNRWETPAAPSRPTKIEGWKGWLLSLAAAAWTALVLGVPLVQLLFWSFDSGQHRALRWDDFWHSLAQSGMAAIFAVIIALALILSHRGHRPLAGGVLNRLCLLGYGLPGTVLAVGVFRWSTWWPEALAVALVVLIYGLVTRYLAVAFHPLQSAESKVNLEQDHASASLGQSRWRTFRAVLLPQVLPGIWAGAVLVFLDVMKEMPITLMTRPTGWDTLSVRIFEFTSEGDWEHAALPSLVLVAVSCLPLLFMGRQRES